MRKDSTLIKGLLRKIDEGNLTEKDENLIKLLKLSHDKDQTKRLTRRQLERAVSRNRQAIFQKSEEPKMHHRKKRIHHTLVYGVAASVAILVLFFSIYFSTDLARINSSVENESEQATENLYTTGDKIKRITLADGSTIFLNKESTISLRKGKFNAFIREVWLDEGEAFFIITKDANRPFIVHSPNGVSTHVLGTSFNIKSYNKLPDQVISVNTGKVQVFNEHQQEIILEPNYKVSISSQDGSFTSGKTDALSVAEWRTGKIVFENASLGEISFRLKQYFDVELIYDEMKFSQDLIYTHFTPEMPLEEVLTILGRLVNATFHKEGKKVYLHKQPVHQKRE
ncbi:MAG: FecR domain-containing protein [Proteiniphilum sp.]|nr:FecR domain-containing protein [Proteiniphilum sp.]